MLCAVCMVLRQYALDAGLMSSLMMPTRQRRTTGPHGDVVEFNVDDYRVQKEVRKIRQLVILPMYLWVQHVHVRWIVVSSHFDRYRFHSQPSS